MSSPDPSANGGLPARPNLLDLNLEPVDPAELRTEEAPTVEVVRLRHPGFGFWKALLWCLLFLLLSQGIPAIVISIGMVAAILREGPGANIGPEWLNSPQGQPIFQMSLFAGQIITVLFSLMVLRWSVGREWKRKIGVRLPNTNHVVLVIVAMPALMTLSMAVESVLVPHIPTLSQLLRPFGIEVPTVEGIIDGTKSWPWMIAVLLIGVGPAIGEELWCRGFLGQGLASRYGNWLGVVLTSFFFGLIHVEPPQAVMTFFMGVFLHVSYLASRSILIPMLMHFLNNALIVLSISNKASVPVVATLETAFQHSPGLSVASSVIVLVTVGTIMYRTRVRILTPSLHELPPSLYPHVETPMQASANKPITDGIAAVDIGVLLVAICLFTAIWYGL